MVAIDLIDNKPYRLIGKSEWIEIKVEADINSSCKANPVNFTNLEKEVKKHSYANKTCVIATMHNKEEAIAPAFLNLLGLQIIKTKIDADQLGTFTREEERKGAPFLKCCRLSDDGNDLVETDMRGHMNPTRMEVIKQLADSFAKRLATPCPLCYNPGWGVVDNQKGLEREMCESETEMVKSEAFGCPKCLHKENRPRQDGLTFVDRQYCGWCNP